MQDSGFGALTAGSSKQLSHGSGILSWKLTAGIWRPMRIKPRIKYDFFGHGSGALCPESYQKEGFC